MYAGNMSLNSTMSQPTDCHDYKPGEIAGKNRPVCKHYILDG